MSCWRRTKIICRDSTLPDKKTISKKATDRSGRRIGIMLGDPSGIGPEIVAKLVEQLPTTEDLEVVIVGDARWFEEGRKIAGTIANPPVIKNIEDLARTKKGPTLLDFPTIEPGTFPVGQVSAMAGAATFRTLKYTVELARDGYLDGFVFAPLNKEAMHLGGNPHPSELSFFRQVFGLPDLPNELNFLDGLWTTRVTSHVGIEQVPHGIKKSRVVRTIRFMHRVLLEYGYEKPRIAVAALNPHGGENGLFGTQESDEIAPAVEVARHDGIEVFGPFPADTIFLRVKKENYRGIVSMYHDQGQIAMKLMGFDQGVTVAAGLPIPIATPAHGTAHDIAGTGKANLGALNAAWQVARRMILNRI